MKIGANGYLTKESAPEELVLAIRKIQSGGKYISDSVAEKLAIHVVADDDKPPHEKLSDREYQIMCMIASGKEVKQIADELSLSVKTVSTYRSLDGALAAYYDRFRFADVFGRSLTEGELTSLAHYITALDKSVNEKVEAISKIFEKHLGRKLSETEVKTLTGISIRSPSLVPR